MKAAIQAQNQQTGSALSRMLNTRGKKMIAVVVVILIVLFGALAALKLSTPKQTKPKIDPEEQARLEKEEKLNTLLTEAAGFYGKDENLSSNGRVYWDKALEKIEEADKLAPGTDAVAKARKIVENGKSLDEVIRFAQARLNRPGFPTSEIKEKLKEAPDLLKEIKDLLAEKAAAYYEGQLKIATDIIEKREKDSQEIMNKISNVQSYLDMEKNLKAKTAAIKKYDEILASYPDCKRVVELRNGLVPEVFPGPAGKKEIKDFTGTPSLIDACRVQADIDADKAAFDPKAEPPMLTVAAAAAPTGPETPAGSFTGGGPTLPPSVKSKYDAKDFTGAAAEAKTLAAKGGAQASRMQTVATALDAMAAAFQAIGSSSDPESLYAAYDKCVTNDAQLAGAYLAECRAGLGKNAKLVAASRLAQGNPEGAFQAYQKAVASGEDASNILKSLEAKAQTLYEDAYKMGDAPGAKDKYAQVLRIVPSTSEVYQKAQARLSGTALPSMDMDIVIMTESPMTVTTPPMTVTTPPMTGTTPPMTGTMKRIIDDDDD